MPRVTGSATTSTSHGVTGSVRAPSESVEPFHTSRPITTPTGTPMTTATVARRIAATTTAPPHLRPPHADDAEHGELAPVPARRDPQVCDRARARRGRRRTNRARPDTVRTSDSRRTAPGTCGSVNGLKSRPSPRQPTLDRADVGAGRVPDHEVGRHLVGRDERAHCRRRHRGAAVERAAVAGARRRDDRARHLHHPHRARLVVVVSLDADGPADAHARRAQSSARRARSRRPGGAAGRGGATPRSARLIGEKAETPVSRPSTRIESLTYSATAATPGSRRSFLAILLGAPSVNASGLGVPRAAPARGLRHEGDSLRATTSRRSP